MGEIILDGKIGGGQDILITKTAISNKKVTIPFNEIINFYFDFNSKTTNYLNSKEMLLRIISRDAELTYFHKSGQLFAKKSQNTFERLHFVYTRLKKILFEQFLEYAIEELEAKDEFKTSKMKFTLEGIYFKPRASFFLKTIFVPYENAEIGSDYMQWGGGAKFSGKNNRVYLEDTTKNKKYVYSRHFNYQPNITEIEKAQALLKYIKDNLE